VRQPGPTLLRNLLGDGLFQHAESISLDHKQFLADDLTLLERIPTIRSVSFGWCRIGDEHVKHLAGLRRLELLQLDDGLISDRGLSNFARLTELQILSLEVNQIHGDGLQYIAGLAKLSNLNLDWNPISDDGLINLESLTNLEMLGLGHTKISDEGIVHLAHLKKLKYLNVGDTQVTRAGAMKLQVELPNCNIEPFTSKRPKPKSGSNPFD
jgi:Leucine-rich repeat (LRR) protein